jgi:O-antigen ligase
VALRAFREVMLEPLAFFALFLLVVSARESRRRALVGALTAAGLVAGIIALIQLATHQDLTYVLGSSIPRVRALYGSPDNLGLLYDRVIPLWLAIGLVGRLTRPARWFWWAPAIIFAPVLALTFSRGAWVAIAAGCLLTLVLTVSWGRWLALACALLAALSVALAGPTVSHAFSAGHANTVRTRIDIWESSISMLKAHPLFGVGPDNFLHYYAPLNDKYAGCRGLGYMKQDAADQPCLSHPHDEILDFWLSTGVLGLLAFLWLQLVFWRSAFHSWRADSAPGDAAIVLGCMAAMAAGLVHGLVDNSYFLPDLAVIFWLLCGLVSSIPATSDRATGK